MNSISCDSDVLIVGAGPVGLYTALTMTKMGIRVRVIDKLTHFRKAKNRSFLWSPRTLQLLSSVGVSEAMLKDGHRLWRFELGGVSGGGMATTSPQHQQNQQQQHQQQHFSPHDHHHVWESEGADANWSLLYDCHSLCDALIKALRQANVDVDYQHELTHLDDIDMPTAEDHTQKIITTVIESKGKKEKWTCRMLIAADGRQSFIRQKLDIRQTLDPVVPGTFYSMEATVANCTFPSGKMSVVRKGPHALFTVGHGKRRYFVFEHQPRWSGLSIQDPVPIAKAQRHIKAILEPYHIEFVTTHAYYGWKAENANASAYSHDRRYFLVGDAAQSLVPPGILSTNVGMEQAHNLCWKIYLHLHQRASPLLLDTYTDESASKWIDASTASKAFMKLIATTPSTGDGRRTLMPDTPYQANIINLDNPSNFSVATTTSSHTVTTASQMLLPPSAIPHAVAHEPGSVGSLAPNPKLKPYTMIQILLAHPTLFPKKQNLHTNASSHVANGSNGSADAAQQQQQHAPRPTQTNQLGGAARRYTSAFSKPLFSLTKFAKKKDAASSPPPLLSHLYMPSSGGAATHASSASNDRPVSPNDRWRVIRQNYFYLLDKIKSDNDAATPMATATTRQVAVTFTVLVFCGDIHENPAKSLAMLAKIRRYLDSSNSFIHRYETNHQQQHQPTALPFYTLPVSSTSSDNLGASSTSLSVSTQQTINGNGTNAANGNPNANGNNPRTSFSSYSVLSFRSSSFSIPRTSVSSTPSSPPTSPTSPSWRRASLDETTYMPDATIARPEHPLFTFAYITTSSKPEIARCLETTPPTLIQAAFPFGLDRAYVDHDKQCHTAFNALPSKSHPHAPTLIVLRPDGYIAARIRLRHDADMDRLDDYFDAFLRPHCDFSSAASLVADAYSL
ncbi:FAD binding domain-containing protein [Gongronella butleri]|nr:FAD binding domain-containing protein [Gongronella butleri]